MSRLNDTAGLTARPLEGEMERTQRVRKIDNGFIVSNSSYNSSTGEYKCSEEYSSSPPKGMGGGTSSRSGVGDEGLSDTKKYLGRNV